MDYLKEFNITDEQIDKIENVLDELEINKDIFIYDADKIKIILNLFKAIGVHNFFNIIITSPSLFFDTIESIKVRIDSYPDKEELAHLLNEDATNLKLIEMY